MAVSAPEIYPVPDTPLDEAGRQVERLRRRKDVWVRVDRAERVRLLRRCIPALLDVADEWVERACAAKGIPPDSSWAGEEWISGPMVTVRYLRLLAESLEAGGEPEPPGMRRGPGDRYRVEVFPQRATDHILYPGVKVDLWLRPGRLPTQGRIYRTWREGRFGLGRVALVLGAGNIASIAPTDALHKLFVEDQVALVKMNPVNAYLGPLLRRALAPLADEGFIDFAYGGPEVGAYLCEHPHVDTLHLTGSDRTFDAIVWGADPAERAERKAAGRPRVDKPFTAELGCVTPVVVAPGPWTAAELSFQAMNVASMVAHNGSFNCNAAKVLVLPRGWRQRDAFLDGVRRALADTPSRPPYYPGARERYRGFLERYPQAEPLSSPAGEVPWTLIPDVPAEPGEYALQNEAFCGVLAQVDLDAGRGVDPASFLGRAVPFVNEHVWGTLSCVLLVPSAARRALGDGLDRAVAELRYGGIGINLWPGVLFGLGSASWGAFPGHTPEAIGSGIGAVHNTLLFDHPERSVAEAPAVASFPKPPWFADHKNLLAVGRKVTRFEAEPSMARLATLGLSALLG